MDILNIVFSMFNFGDLLIVALAFLMAYTWTTKVDNVDTVLAAHINLLQTEKLDRDGAIALTGEFDAGANTIGFTEQTATGDGTTTIPWTDGNKFFFTYGAQNDTFTFTAPTKPCNLLLVLKQDGVGGRTPTWPGTVKWPTNGTEPTWSSGANDIDIVSFYYDGTNYYAQAGLDFD